MHTNIIIRKKTTRICTILSVCALGLYITACDSGELPDKENDPANTKLRFTASISDSPSTKAAHGSGIIDEAAFPDGTHTFGMFITRDGGGALVAGSGDNMKSTLTRATAQDDVWGHTDKNGGALSLVAKHGDEIKITGYYPWVSGATANSVPFDLSGDMSTCTDLFYLSSPAGAQQVTDGSSVALTFSHAYCWVTINLSKLTDKNNVIVKSVRIENSSNNLERIMNKGTIDPKTGNVVTGTPGSLVIDCDPTVSIPLNEPGSPSFTPITFNFLVPSFMRTDVQDSEIVIRIITEVSSGTNEVLSFPLSKAHLNHTDNLYGFKKGMHNTYNIVYNNGEMILSLSNWDEVWIGAPTLGEGTAGVKPIEMPYQDYGIAQPPALKKLAMGDHINHSYLGEVAENNNGKYVTIEPGAAGLALFDLWRPFVTTEPFFPSLKVSRNNAAGGSPVPWKDKETGVLMAKQACAEFREGGYTDWRLPRISEFFMFVYAAPKDLNLGSKDIWSATEYNADESYYLGYNWSFEGNRWLPQHVSKTAEVYVRCVRDSNKPKPTI